MVDPPTELLGQRRSAQAGLWLCKKFGTGFGDVSDIVFCGGAMVIKVDW